MPFTLGGCCNLIDLQDVAATAPNKPATYIAETGWPTQSMTVAEGNSGTGTPAGDASVANLQSKSGDY